MKKPLAFLILLIALTGLLVLNKEVPQTAPARSGVILAFGDSLTYGYGADRHQSYPAMLQRMSGVRVINAGISGETSSEGLRRLESLLKQHHPDLLILCHGGNDILQRLPREALRSNLSGMVHMTRAYGADVLLVGIPDIASLGFSPLPLYEEVADADDLIFESSVIGKIMRDARLKSDRIHPNAEGYRLMAEAFYDLLKDNGKL
jgi:lysophospholipase L1-like esterase